VALGALAVVVTMYETAYAPQPLLLLSLSFALIANGTNLWGLLSHQISRSLGEVTYSIYLLHGPLLFLVLRFVVGFDALAQFTPMTYWGLIGVLAPALLVLAALSHRWLEMPCMRQTTAWTNRLRKQFPGSATA
jgi:peptidoglycan/LPS O-acetylase OafA/YrhL